MGNVSIDLSQKNIWKSWFKFKKGKRKTRELDLFQYFLEKNISELYNDLNSGTYRHGGYHKFIVNDNKRREISVADIRDRVVHRLLYSYLVETFDRILIDDVWSCRKSKGLVGAIERTQEFLKKYPLEFVWRSDVKKFFDSVDQKCLKDIIYRKVSDQNACSLVNKIIDSYSISFNLSTRETSKDKPRLSTEQREGAMRRYGIPIGNLTSQIFANIYLNELDQFVFHKVRPLAYLRYGDDFIIVDNTREKLLNSRRTVRDFLDKNLRLEINKKNDIIVRVKHGLKFLGVEIFSKGRRLKKRNLRRAEDRLNLKNVASYKGLIDKHSKKKHRRYYNWIVLNKIIE